jgi:hypothetical protein
LTRGLLLPFARSALVNLSSKMDHRCSARLLQYSTGYGETGSAIANDFNKVLKKVRHGTFSVFLVMFSLLIHCVYLVESESMRREPA